MKVYVTRSSVAAGDDGDAPHARTFEFPDRTTLEAILAGIVTSKYLASIQGGMASWSVMSNIPVAVIAQQWTEPRMLGSIPEVRDRALDREGGMLRLQFNYHGQIDPEVVARVLKQLEVRAERV